MEKEKIKLHIRNVMTTIEAESLDRDLLNVINDCMSYKLTEYNNFTKQYSEFSYPLFDKKTLKYPTGLFSTLNNILTNYNIEYDVIDHRTLPDSKKSLSFVDRQPRDYQQEVIEKAIQCERGIIKVATGGGKTTIGAGIIAQLNLNTLFIVNSIDLLEQASDEFKKMLGIEIGKIGGGEFDVRQVNVCTIQTLFYALDLKYDTADDELMIKEKISDSVKNRKEEIVKCIGECELIIVDESQHLSSKSYVYLMTAAKRAYYKFGLSATPFKDESTDLIINAYSGKLICDISASYLIKRGFLIKPKIHFLNPNKFDHYKYIKGVGFRGMYNKWIVNNKNRNNLIFECAERLLDIGRTTLITVTRIEHGEIIADKISKLNSAKMAFLKGEVKKEQRKKILDEVRNNKLNILIGTSVADEGLDVPILDAAIIAGGGKSMIKTIQRVGRTLRPYPNVQNNVKKDAIIVDFYDRLNFLTGQSKKRMDIYKKEEEFEVIENFVKK